MTDLTLFTLLEKADTTYIDSYEVEDSFPGREFFLSTDKLLWMLCDADERQTYFADQPVLLRDDGSVVAFDYGDPDSGEEPEAHILAFTMTRAIRLEDLTAEPKPEPVPAHLRIYPDPCPDPVRKAIEHVVAYYPGVNHVLFTREGRWLFMDETGLMPKFGPEIRTELLEDAVDALRGLPMAFCAARG